MVANYIDQLKKHEFSENFLLWATTLVFLPIAIYIRFVIGTSLILDKNYPDYLQMVLFLGVGLIIWLGRKWIRNEPITLTGFEPFLSLFFVLACLSTALSVNPSLSLEKLIGISGYLLCIYILLDVKRNKYLWQGIANGLLITAAISSIAILITIAPYWENYQLTINQVLADPIYAYKALPRLPYSLLFHPSVTAGYLVLILPLGFYQFFTARKLSWKIIQAAGILINMIVLVMTRSRGGLLGLLLMVVAAAVVYREKLLEVYKTNRLVVILAVSILGGLGIAFFVFLASTRGFDLSGWSIQSRIQLWKAAAMIISENPLLGSGPGTYGQEYLKYRDPAFNARSFIHAHNQFLQIAVELGLLGLLCLLAIFWKYLRAIKRAKNQNSAILRFGAIAFVGLFGVLLPDAIFTSAMIVFLVIFYLVWLLPPREPRYEGSKKTHLVLVTVFSILVGIGAGWIAWKIDPYYKALIHAYQGNWQQSTDQLEVAMARDPQNPYYHYLLGFTTGQEACYLDEGYSIPIEYYVSSLTSYPNWDISHVNLAGLYRASGDYVQAANHMKEAIEAYPHKPFYNCLLGDYYLELGRTDEALKEYSICVIGDPKILDSSYWGMSEQKISLQEQVLDLAINSITVQEQDLLLESEFYYYNTEYQAAEELVLEYLGSDPFDVNANLLYFKIQEGTGKLPEIEDRLESMLRKFPDRHFLWIYKGKLALLNGDILTAEYAFKISDMRIPTFYSELALVNIYHDSGSVDIAEAYFRKALLIDAFPALDFSRHVAGRWPMPGVYNSCLPGIYTYEDYLNPALETAKNLEEYSCIKSACLYNKLMKLNPSLEEAREKFSELPCFQDFDSGYCFPDPE